MIHLSCQFVSQVSVSFFHPVSVSVSVSVSGSTFMKSDLRRTSLKLHCMEQMKTFDLYEPSICITTFCFHFSSRFRFRSSRDSVSISVSVLGSNFTKLALVRTSLKLHCMQQMKMCGSSELSICITSFCFCFSSHFCFCSSHHFVLFPFLCQA